MSPSIKNEHKNEQTQILRRDFLRAGLLLPLALTPLAEMLAVPPVYAQTQRSPFVVGYQEAEGATVINATQIKQGDALFQHTGVSVRIAGFHPDGQSESKITGAQVVSLRSFLHFYSEDPDQPIILVPAWSSEVQTLGRGDTVINLAAPVCMTVPLCPDGSLVLSLSVCCADAPVTTQVVRLTTGRGQGAKLLRGTYCIAAGKTGSTAVEWNNLALKNVLNEGALPSSRDTESRDAPDFPCLVVRVDHAANTLPSTCQQNF